MTQQTMFGADDNKDAVRRLEQRRRSRPGDPPTSHQAEQYIQGRMGKLRAAVLAVADEYPRTARELAERACVAGAEVESYRKRVRELCDAGMLRQCSARKCAMTGRSAGTFVRG